MDVPFSSSISPRSAKPPISSTSRSAMPSKMEIMPWKFQILIMTQITSNHGFTLSLPEVNIGEKVALICFQASPVRLNIWVKIQQTYEIFGDRLTIV